MRKIISIITLLITIFTLANNITNAKADNGKTYFRVTAYYSPLPNQRYYIKGNYWAEKRMNGEGIRGASGKLVFSGMLAAPAKYSFGTKISLKGLGVGEVADRGGAIVKAGERKFKYDRIDVWVGYGDEGLRRAMYWGNRVIEGSIINSSSKTTLDYKKIPAPTWAIPKTKQAKNYISKKIIKTIEEKTDFEILLEKELKIFEKKVETEDETKVLQERLKNLGLYDGNIDGNYNNITKVISNYQLEKELIKKIGDAGTGYFGPKTRASLKETYKKLLTKKEEEKQKIIEFEKKLEALKNESEDHANKKLEEIGMVKFGEVSPSVRELQKTLNKLGYFEHKDTAIFGNKTKQAILDYQIEKNIIANIYVPGAGHFGPATRKQLRDDIANKILLENLTNNTELSEYYMKKKQEVAKNFSENKKI